MYKFYEYKVLSWLDRVEYGGESDAELLSVVRKIIIWKETHMQKKVYKRLLAISLGIVLMGSNVTTFASDVAKSKEELIIEQAIALDENLDLDAYDYFDTAHSLPENQAVSPIAAKHCGFVEYIIKYSIYSGEEIKPKEIYDLNVLYTSTDDFTTEG